ncbi:enoyl-CoA hydratase/isomerase family protein [Microbacterium sp. EYE_5]|uniref:enoyl-CoA hydratase/isomerase family protein n=1 Tax=unclassified Microbacterium TaxID=2609290 RepID=UPI002003D337|nr:MULTISPECIES: enoyl-CoA hydratase/isomerase family protein [unclassified Microbacterium]MCK6080791.1 enoyl-CoA hydratase/isomerase family protein [Microbacterium sp. EYE_382]MCK6086062.1 enoyl-CoA hydratase/isomerase family protein [Microbacterium sp. EYE_384]MCK6124440.1 enoyl-CoA hydratase/isomerase family protein [Microbacterium sp. EYE_80]MCK6127349.1 enoyl-CoA hydratase/isomerase family protein [Microbacterium sp. EYE_79]MCK6141746.1 enoyl-CoA hydratase/isomerase family protein [Microb
MIDLQIQGDVAHIRLDNPARLNALDEQAVRDLHEAYRAAGREGVRALTLTGEGRSFCAGRDISGVDPRDDDVLGYLEGLVAPLMRTMAEFPAPTFAVAQGAALGVGLGLLIATDVVYVADDAKIGSPFAALGATLDSGGHALFFERLGAHRALDLIYTGRLMSGEEAVHAGLFSRCYPAAELEQAVQDAATTAAAGATQAFVASKRLIAQLRAHRVGLWDAISAENRAQAALCDTADYREGFAAFQEKRRPEFRGR